MLLLLVLPVHGPASNPVHAPYAEAPAEWPCSRRWCNAGIPAACPNAAEGEAAADVGRRWLAGAHTGEVPGVGRGPRDQPPPRCCLQALPWHDSGLQTAGCMLQVTMCITCVVCMWLSGVWVVQGKGRSGGLRTRAGASCADEAFCAQGCVAELVSLTRYMWMFPCGQCTGVSPRPQLRRQLERSANLARL